MNKKQTYIGIAVIVLIFGLLVIPKIIRRISNGDVTRGGRMHVIKDKTDNDELSYIQFEGKDRKVPSYSFVNQLGDTITNDTFKRKVYVVEFFFTRCPGICIPMNQNLVFIADYFKDEPNFGIASISIDPDHDTPEVLQAYAEGYGITHPNWHFLTGNFTDPFQLSVEGFYLNAEKRGRNRESIRP